MLNDARAPRRSLRFLPSRQAALSSLAKRNTLADITSSDVTSSESAVSQYSPDSLSSLSSETNTELDIRRPRHSLGKGAKKASAQAYRASNTSQSSSLLSNSLVSCSDSSTDPYAFEESCEQLHEEHWNNSRTGSGSCRSSSSGDIDKLQSSNSCLAAFPTKLVTSSLDKQYIQDLGPKKVHPITRERKPFTADSFFSDEEESIATTSSSTALLYAPSTSYPPNMKQGSDVLSEQGKKRVKSNDEKKCREKLSPARRGWRAKTEPSSKQPLRRLPPTPPRPHSSEACADAPTAAPSLIKIAEDKETLNLGKTQPMPEQCQQSDALSRPSIKSRLGPEVNNKDDSISDNEQILTRPKSQRVTRQSSAGHLPEQKRSPLVTRSASLSSLGSPDSSESTAGSLISNQSPSLPASSRLATKRRRSTNTDSQRRRAPTRGLALIRHALSGLMMQPPLPKRARHSVPPVDKGLFTDLSDGDRVPDLLLNLQTRHLSPSPNKQLLRMPEIVEIIEFPQEFISGTIEPIKQILSSQVNLTNDCFLQTKMHTDEIYNTTSNTFLNVGTEHVQMDIAHADFELNQVSLIEESQPLFKAKKLPPTLVCAPKLSIYNQAKRMCPHQTDVVPFQVTPAWKYSPALHRPYSYIISQKYALPVTSQCPPLISANLINLPTFAKAAVESVVCETFEAKKNVLKCTGNSATDMTSSNMDHYVTIDETSDDTDSLPLDMSASFHTLTKTPSHTHMHKSDSEHAGYHLIDKSLTKTPSHTHMHKSDSEHARYHLIDKFKKSESAVANEQWDSDEFLDIIDVDPEESNKKSDDENDDDIKFVEECIGINRRACSEPGHLSSTLTVVQANVAPVVVKVEECATTLQTSISPSKLVSENTRDLGLQLSTQSGSECKSAATSFHSLKSRLQLALQKGALAKKPDTIDGKSVNSSKPKHHRSSSSKNGNDHAKSDPLRSKSKKEKKLKKHKRKHKGSKQELSESKRPSEKPSPVKISHTGNKSCILIQSKSCKKRRREPVSLEDSLIFYPVPSENNDQNKNGCKLATLNNPQKLSKAHPSHVSPELNDTKHANHAKKRKSDSPIEQSKHKKPKPSRNIEGSSSAKSKKRHEEGSSKPHRSKLPWCDRTITDVLRCQRCDFICLEQNDLVEHKQEVHAAKVASLAPCEYDPVVNQNVQYKCTLCGLADDQLKRIRMHITAEHGGKLHSCERVTHTRGENGFSLLVESVRVYKE